MRLWVVVGFTVSSLIALSLVMWVPVRWQGAPPLPPYRLSHALYNEYLKKKHQYGRRPLDVRVCHDNLRDLVRIFRDTGITEWWVAEGSALGLYREQRLLPWDDDVDLTVDEVHMRQFFAETYPRLQQAGFLHVLNGRKTTLLCLARGGEKVDVGFFTREKICNEGYMPGQILARHVAERQMARVAEFEVPIPSQESYYVALYGADWRTPHQTDKSDAGDRSV